MIKLERYTGEKIYMYPNGAVATPDRVKSDYPAVEYFPHVIEVNGNTLSAIYEIGAIRQYYNIDETLTDDEAILAIQDIRNAPAEVVITAEERIASALEYQNLMSI